MSRLNPNYRKSLILASAVLLSEQGSYREVTRDQIAASAECSPALVSAYLGTMKQMRRSIMSEAVRTKNLKIIAQGIIAKEAKALSIAPELRKEALDLAMGA